MGDLLTSADLISLNSSNIPDFAKGFANSDFWYYTRLSTAIKILESQTFWVSNICDMNDLDELELHKKEREKLYALCFCNSNTEKIPMWYLYSGIAGTGVSLGFTPGLMLSLLKSLENVYGVDIDDNRDSLTIGKDIQFRYGWVYYRKQNELQSVLYRNKWYSLIDPTEFSNSNYFLKAYPWEYEKEFRIVFINRTKKKYKRIIVPLDNDVCDRIKLRLAPEMNESEIRKLKKIHYNNKPIESRIQYSNLKIKMNLFHRNISTLPDYLREEFKKRQPDIAPSTLCTLIKEASACETKGSK